MSATARVIIIVGAEEDGPVNLIPSHPINPIAVATENIMINKEEKVPVTERRRNAITIKMTKNIIGTIELMSFWEASPNA